MVIVMVWNYGGLWKGGVMGKENVGHAAARIITNDPEKPFYISWWPGGVDPDGKNKTKSCLRSKMPDPHSFRRDLVGEGDKMRNSKEFRKFIKQLKRESKKHNMFIDSEMRKMIANEAVFDLEVWNQKLEKHKNITSELVNSLEKADNLMILRRYHECLEDLVISGDCSIDLMDLYRDMGTNSGVVLRPPDTSVHIPGMSNGVPCGIDDATMVEWWIDYFMGDNSDRRRYRLTVENCSTIVSYALIAGGALMHAKIPGKTLGKYWNPSGIKKFANSILVSVAERYKLYNQFFAENCATLENEDIWTARTFKRESNAGKMSHRYEALKKIDSMLDYYHGMRQEPSVRSIGERMGTLAKIVATLQQIHNNRPKSKRKGAINALGSQCIAKITHTLLPEYVREAEQRFHIYYAMLEGRREESRIF